MREFEKCLFIFAPTKGSHFRVIYSEDVLFSKLEGTPKNWRLVKTC